MSSFIFQQILQVYRGLAMPAGSVTRRNLALFPLNISFNIISVSLSTLLMKLGNFWQDYVADNKNYSQEDPQMF